MVNKSKSFMDLIVWQKAHQFVLEIYKASQAFPKSELYGLTSQLRRAAISVPANIAEGFVKSSNKDKVRFMNIAQGSVEECKYYLILVNDLKYINTRDLKELLNEVGKLLYSYARAIYNSYS